MWNIRRLAQVVAMLTAMVLVWSGPAAAVLAQDDATSPGDQPLEIVVDGARFVFDRIVPIDLGELEEGADEAGNPVFTRTDDPAGAVYVPVDDATAARYLPESLDAPDTSCLSEGVAAGNITAGEDVYVPAGPEPDLGTDALTEVGSTDDGRAIYAPSQEQPFTELFADSDEGLIRYLLLGDAGAPETFPATVTFAGQEFEVATDAAAPGTDGLTKVGCLGPFPALAEEGSDAPFSTVYLSLNDQVITYQALDAPAETAEATEEAATPPEAAETPDQTEEPEPATPPDDAAEAETGTITVQAAFCEADNSDNANSNCNGRIEQAEDTTVVFEVRADGDTEGDPVQTIEVVIEQQGNGSQGEGTGEALPLGVFTVCQDPVEGFDAVPLPSDQGGNDQSVVEGLPCITVELTSGNTVLQFNNFPVEAPAPAETATPPATPDVTEVPTEIPTEVPTEVPPTEEPTPTAVPPTEVPTAVPTEVPTEVPPTEVPATEAPEPTAVPTEVPAPTDVPATVAPTAVPTDAPAPTEVPAAPAAPATQAPATGASTETPVDPAAPTPPPTPRPTPTPRVYQPRAVVPTPAPNAPPPAVATAPATQCSGVTGELDANGVPERLANTFQYGGTGYQFVSVVPSAEAGNLTLVGCVGPFEAYRSDAQDADTVLFLALPDGGGGNLFRYNASASFNVTFEVSENPQSLTLQAREDQPETRYTASEPWVRSVYSSVTLILYVADPNNAQPEVIYGRAVDADVIAEYVPEGTVEAPSEEVMTLAEQTGLQPDLTLGEGGARYVLANVWLPFGTTTNGWLTLYGPNGEAVPARLVGVDPRRLDLLIFEQAE